MLEIPIWGWPLMFITGVAAGLVDSIAGGGGLITVPALLGVGLSPGLALGTNKLQSCFGSASAAWSYTRAGLISFRDCLLGVACTILGAASGALAVRFISDAALRRVLPVLLIAIGLFVLLRPKLGEADARERMRPILFYASFGIGLGAYDGFFGPGVGSFWALAFVLCLGFNLSKATAHTKVMNFTSNFVALVVLGANSQVMLLPGLVMGAGQMIGASFGAGLVIRRGTHLVRPVFVFVVFLIAIKMLLSNR
jgi:uncharacterized membrane protein YfcA